MKLEIHTFDKELLTFMFAKENVLEGEQIILPGVVLKYDRTLIRKVVHFPRIIHFELEVTNNDGPSNFAEWMNCRLKKKQVERILVESTEIPFDEASIRTALEDRFRDRSND